MQLIKTFKDRGMLFQAASQNALSGLIFLVTLIIMDM